MRIREQLLEKVKPNRDNGSSDSSDDDGDDEDNENKVKERAMKNLDKVENEIKEQDPNAIKDSGIYAMKFMMDARTRNQQKLLQAIQDAKEEMNEVNEDSNNDMTFSGQKTNNDLRKEAMLVSGRMTFRGPVSIFCPDNNLDYDIFFPDIYNTFLFFFTYYYYSSFSPLFLSPFKNH